MKRIVIVGVGLIGGSFALALKANGFKGEIVGAGRSATRLQVAQDLGVIDRFETDLAEAVRGCELVLLAVPMGAMRSTLLALRSGLSDETIISDAGSVKGSFVADVRSVLANCARVVPGHPIAGTENSGVEAAFATLYQGRRVILTPLEESEPSAVAAVQALWQQTGAQVECLAVEHHDRVLAATSHLPHLLAFSLVNTLTELQEREEIFRYAAGGFRDFSRIASSDPRMWRDISLANQEALLAVLGNFQANLSQLAESIRQRDGEAIEQRFQRAKLSRDGFCG
ncbi:MAG: prephenate dehydrogenase/arogenate dehydrogenase family protein [Gammaproteobacteria bacterium]|nr:prephenate dehydrogenase/arogenate dehydrogenase family protein [Gammaproteobacteria bacterium]